MSNLSWLLARKIRDSGWICDVIVAIGRGGFIVSRLLCDLLGVEKSLALPIKWYELEKKRGETYLADLIRVFAKAHEGGSSPDEGIAEVVSKLKVGVSIEQSVNLNGQRALLVEEIVATGMHFKLAKEIVRKDWKAGEIRTATLVWKAPPETMPDYYVIRPGKFVWFQFPWSRLRDYVQLLRVMLLEESRREKKLLWPKDMIQEKFKLWYGAEPEPKYFEEATRILEADGVIKQTEMDKILVKLSVKGD
ncbi:MAG: phosphoribosyltransferase family protein [Candidatus Bathyarchaeia archaeon]